MLYKKIHRQYLRKWRIGRKFKYNRHVYEVTKKPYIDIERGSIRIDNWHLILIPITGPSKGALIYIGIEWVED